MSDSNNVVMVRIVGEPFLSRAKVYKAGCIAADTAWREFAIARGAIGIWAGPSLTGLQFGITHPEGWKEKTKPARLRGTYFPVKGHTEESALAALPHKPPVSDVYGTAIVDQMSYKGPDHSGGGSIGFPWSMWVGWVGDSFYGKIPYAIAAVAEHMARHPEDVIEEPAKSWALPAGLELISEARYNLEVAQYKVAMEEKGNADGK